LSKTAHMANISLVPSEATKKRFLDDNQTPYEFKASFVLCRNKGSLILVVAEKIHSDDHVLNDLKDHMKEEGIHEINIIGGGDISFTKDTLLIECGLKNIPSPSKDSLIIVCAYLWPRRECRIVNEAYNESMLVTRDQLLTLM